MENISAAILWTTLRSLSIAMHFKSVGFKNLDIVSSELVNFLLFNTEYDSINKLEKQVTTLEASKKELISAVKGTTTVAATASNKVDEFKKTIITLEKKIK